MALPGTSDFMVARIVYPVCTHFLVAVCNDGTVTGYNLDRKGWSGDCLGPVHFGQELWWRCVMTSLSQVRILT